MANEVKKCNCGKEYPKSFSIGDRIRVKSFGDEYILCLTGGDNLRAVQLTNLKTGSLFCGFSTVHDLKNISADEFNKMLNGYELVCPNCLSTYKVVEKTYCIGQRFKNYCGDIYLMCSFGPDTIGAVNISSGCRWGDGVYVMDCLHITQTELNELFDSNKFTLVEDD